MIPYIARPEAQVQHWTETQNLRACCQSTVGRLWVWSVTRCMAVRVTVTECVHSGEWSVGVGGGGSIPSPPRARGTEYNTTRGSLLLKWTTLG